MYKCSTPFFLFPLFWHVEIWKEMKFCHEDSDKDGLFQGDAKETSKGVAGDEGEDAHLGGPAPGQHQC